jgi:hypothetical protein
MFRHEKVFAMERNCIVGQKQYNIKFFSFRIRNFNTPIIESVRTSARITSYPTGRLLWGGAVPGTLCQATIAQSLRDISQQALTKLEDFNPEKVDQTKDLAKRCYQDFGMDQNP